MSYARPFRRGHAAEPSGFVIASWLMMREHDRRLPCLVVPIVSDFATSPLLPRDDHQNA